MSYGLAIRKAANGAFDVTRYGHYFWPNGYAVRDSAVKALAIARGLCEGQPMAALAHAPQGTRLRALKEWRALHRNTIDGERVEQAAFAFAQLDT